MRLSLSLFISVTSYGCGKEGKKQQFYANKKILLNITLFCGKINIYVSNNN